MFETLDFPGGDDPDDDAPLLATFVYSSRAAATVDDAEVERIILSAQRRNVSRGITGVLVFSNGVFVQWVEGPVEQVQSLIAILHSDPRHHDIVTLDWSEEKRERLYPDWDMEHVEAADIRAVLQEALETAEDEKNVSILMRTLEHLGSGPLGSFGHS